MSFILQSPFAPPKSMAAVAAACLNSAWGHSRVSFLFSCQVTSDSLQPHWFPRQENWSELPFPPPGDLDPGIGLMYLMSLPLAGGFFTFETPVKPCVSLTRLLITYKRVFSLFLSDTSCLPSWINPRRSRFSPSWQQNYNLHCILHILPVHQIKYSAMNIEADTI